MHGSNLIISSSRVNHEEVEVDSFSLGFSTPIPDLDYAPVSNAANTLLGNQEKALQAVDNGLNAIGRLLVSNLDVGMQSADKGIVKQATTLQKTVDKAWLATAQQGSYALGLSQSAGLQMPQQSYWELYQNSNSGCYTCTPNDKPLSLPNVLINLYNTEQECNQGLQNYASTSGVTGVATVGYTTIPVSDYCHQGNQTTRPPILTTPTSPSPTTGSPLTTSGGTPVAVWDSGQGVFVPISPSGGSPVSPSGTTPTSPTTPVSPSGTTSIFPHCCLPWRLWNHNVAPYPNSAGYVDKYAWRCPDDPAPGAVCPPFPQRDYTNDCWYDGGLYHGVEDIIRVMSLIPGLFGVLAAPNSFQLVEYLRSLGCYGTQTTPTTPPTTPPIGTTPPCPQIPSDCVRIVPCTASSSQPIGNPPTTPPVSPPTTTPQTTTQGSLDSTSAVDITVGAQLTGGTAGGLCADIVAFKEWCIHVGEQLLQGGSESVLPRDALETMLYYLAPGNWGSDDVIDHIHNQLKTQGVHYILSRYAEACAFIFKYPSDNLRRLLAVKAVLLEVSSIRIEGVYHHADEKGAIGKAKTGVGLGGGFTFLGNLFDVGGKVGLETEFSRGEKYGSDYVGKLSIAPVLMPSLKASDYLIAAETKVQIPTVKDAIEFYIQDTITSEELICLGTFHGERVEYIEKAAYCAREKLTGRQAIEYIRRTTVDSQQWDKLCHAILRILGWTDEKEREAFITLYDEIPSIERHLIYLRKTVDLWSYVAENGLSVGFSSPQDVVSTLIELKEDAQPGSSNDPDFQAAMQEILQAPPNDAFAGRDFWKTFGRQLRVKSQYKTTALNEYLAHWQSVPVGQTNEMLQRCRRKRAQQQVDREVASGTLPAGTTPQQRLQQLTVDLNRWKRFLSEQDIAPGVLDLYRMIAYSPITLRFLRELYSTGFLSDEEARDALEDLGYHPETAAKQQRALEIKKRRDLASSGHGWSISEIAKLFTAGEINEITFTERMAYLGFPDDAIKQSIARCLEDFNHDIRRKKTANLHQCYLRGRVGDDAAKQGLLGLGFNPDRVDAIVSVWSGERECKMEGSTKGELITAFKDGIIPANELVQRLLVSNYTPQAVATILAIAVYDMLQKQKKQEEKNYQEQLKQQEKLQKELLKQLRAQQRRSIALEKVQVNLQKALERAEMIKEIGDIKGAAKRDLTLAQEIADKGEAQYRFFADPAAKQSEVLTDIANQDYQLGRDSNPPPIQG